MKIQVRHGYVLDESNIKALNVHNL